MKIEISQGWVTLTTDNGLPQGDPKYNPIGTVRSMSLAQYEKHAADSAFAAALAPADQVTVQAAIDATKPAPAKS